MIIAGRCARQSARIVCSTMLEPGLLFPASRLDLLVCMTKQTSVALC